MGWFYEALFPLKIHKYDIHLSTYSENIYMDWMIDLCMLGYLSK